MSNLNDFDVSLEKLFGGEMESLEDERDAAELWEKLKQSPAAKARYDAIVLAMRYFAGRKGVKSFGEDEADVMWPVLMGQVAEGSRQRSGLSKEALRHMVVPELVSSISRAIMSYSQQTEVSETAIEAAAPAGAHNQAVNFSIASVGGQVSLRLYKNEDIGFVANVSDGEVKTNVADAALSAWVEVQGALNTLSLMTAELLGDDVLVNGHIEIKDGRAEVRMRPLVRATAEKK